MSFIKSRERLYRRIIIGSRVRQRSYYMRDKAKMGQQEIIRAVHSRIFRSIFWFVFPIHFFLKNDVGNEPKMRESRKTTLIGVFRQTISFFASFFILCFLLWF